MFKVKVNWFLQHGTSQIYSSGVEMALCSAELEDKGLTQIGPFVYCKDFFQDAIKGFVNDTSSSIYGYSYNPKTQPPIDLTAVRTLITNDEDNEFLKKVPSLLDLLNQIEKKMGLKRTEAFVCENPPKKYSNSGVVLLVGSGKWLQSPASLSMYTLLARNGLVHKTGQAYDKTIKAIIEGKLEPGQKNDNVYLKYGLPGIELIIDKGITEVFGKDLKDNYKSSIATHVIHHYGGIVAFGSCKTKAYWPQWEHPSNPTNPPGICFS